MGWRFVFVSQKKKLRKKLNLAIGYGLLVAWFFLILLLSLLFIRNQVLLSWAVLLGLLIIACFRTRLFKNSSLTTSLTRYGLFFFIGGANLGTL